MLGLIDLESTKVQKGTQVIPLKHKILSGYNDEVAIRRLVDVTDEQRETIHQTIMKVIQLPLMYTIKLHITTSYSVYSKYHRMHDNTIFLLLYTQLSKELEGTYYEKDFIEMIMSGFDFGEEFLGFLKNDEEDVSTIFCSELVAHAYQEAGLLGGE